MPSLPLLAGLWRLAASAGARKLSRDKLLSALLAAMRTNEVRPLRATYTPTIGTVSLGSRQAVRLPLQMPQPGAFRPVRRSTLTGIVVETSEAMRSNRET